MTTVWAAVCVGPEHSSEEDFHAFCFARCGGGGHIEGGAAGGQAGSGGAGETRLPPAWLWTNSSGATRSSNASSHAERNAVSAAYNFAEHPLVRRKMMQAWTDYLDALKGCADVIPPFKKA